MSPRTDESIGITFSEERSDDPSEQTLLGPLLTYTDPYEQAGLGMECTTGHLTPTQTRRLAYFQLAQATSPLNDNSPKHQFPQSQVI